MGSEFLSTCHPKLPLCKCATFLGSIAHFTKMCCTWKSGFKNCNFLLAGFSSTAKFIVLCKGPPFPKQNEKISSLTTFYCASFLTLNATVLPALGFMRAAA